MTGYEKSRDYGGPPVGRWTTALGLVVMLGAALAFALYAASQS